MMLHKPISSSISRSIACSLLLALAFVALPTLSMAQNATPKMSKAEQERLRLKQVDDSTSWWRGFQVKADLVGLIQLAASSYGQYEAGVRINLKDKYFPIVEMGYGKANETNDVTQTSYKASAPYGKIGCDFNILRNKHDIYRLYVGGRIAYTSFTYDVDHAPLTDPVWGDQVPFEGHGQKAKYGWLEAVVSIDAKIAGPVHLGWSARYKRRLTHDEGDLGNTWYVPGFGKQGSTRLGGTFDIIVEF